jgi:hypothetical protein
MQCCDEDPWVPVSIFTHCASGEVKVTRLAAHNEKTSYEKKMLLGQQMLSLT